MRVRRRDVPTPPCRSERHSTKVLLHRRRVYGHRLLPQHQRYRCRWGNVHVRRREMLRGAVLPQRRVPWLRRVRGHEQTLSDHLVVQVRRLGLRWFPTLLRRQTLPRSAHVPRLRNREFPVSSNAKVRVPTRGAAPASWVSTARNGGAPPFPRARTDKALLRTHRIASATRICAPTGSTADKICPIVPTT